MNNFSWLLVSSWIQSIEIPLCSSLSYTYLGCSMVVGHCPDILRTQGVGKVQQLVGVLLTGPDVSELQVVVSSVPAQLQGLVLRGVANLPTMMGRIVRAAVRAREGVIQRVVGGQQGVGQSVQGGYLGVGQVGDFRVLGMDKKGGLSVDNLCVVVTQFESSYLGYVFVLRHLCVHPPELVEDDLPLQVLAEGAVAVNGLRE